MEKFYKFRLRSKGFSLFELLLVVVVLAIVAVATAPLLFEGSKESLIQARKSQFFNAYKLTLDGANTMLGIANMTKGNNWNSGWNMDKHPIVLVAKMVGSKEYNEVATNGDKSIWKDGKVYKILEYFVPSKTRQFLNNKGVKFTLSADIVFKGTSNENAVIVVVCKANTGDHKYKTEYFGDKLTRGDGNKDSWAGCPIYIDGDVKVCLEKFWDIVADLDETTTLGQQPVTDAITNREWDKTKKKYN